MSYRRMVIKIGSSTLTGGTRKIAPASMIDLVRTVCALRQDNWQVLVVSSGAIAAGRELLGYPDLPKFIPAKQMLAAIGQPRLMAIYEQFFGIYDVRVAQVLLTRADLFDRRRFLNARNTLDALLNQQVVPIINENDTVATEEIKFGDNDNLSAHVANLVEADVLVLLTDQDGLYSGDPRYSPDAFLLKRIDTPDIPKEIWNAAGGAGSGIGTGGMITKLQAADLARRSGTTVVIASGKESENVLRIAKNEALGTWFTPVVDHLEARKRYILAAGETSGEVSIDLGAEAALKNGGSLLPVGVLGCSGGFDRGDPIKVISMGGNLIGIGLSNYQEKDLEQFKGKHSDEIEGILGFSYGDEVIHRNNLVMIENSR
jgi:glutamate 5-kinase